MAERVVAVHQPNYVPWPGYFHKLAHADVFVYLDSVQYPARTQLRCPQPHQDAERRHVPDGADLDSDTAGRAR